MPFDLQKKKTSRGYSHCRDEQARDAVPSLEFLSRVCVNSSVFICRRCDTFKGIFLVQEIL